MDSIRFMDAQAVQDALTMADAIDWMEQVYRLYSRGEADVFPIITHEFDGMMRNMDIKSGHLDGADIVGLKMLVRVRDNPQKRGLPNLTGLVLVSNSKTGQPIGLLDGLSITNMRTGAAGGLAAKTLARQDSRSAIIVGAGYQGRMQALALMEALPGLESITFASRTRQKAEQLVEELARELFGQFAGEFGGQFDEELAGLSAYDRAGQASDHHSGHVSDDRATRRVSKLAEERPPVHFGTCGMDELEERLATCDVLVTCTNSKEPLIKKGWIQPGTHINSIGADMHGKNELDPALVARARVFADSTKQVTLLGECQHAYAAGLIDKDDITEIGDVLEGKKPGRTAEADITIFDATGMAIQDLIVGAKLLERHRTMS